MSGWDLGFRNYRPNREAPEVKQDTCFPKTLVGSVRLYVKHEIFIRHPVTNCRTTISDGWYWGWHDPGRQSGQAVGWITSQHCVDLFGRAIFGVDSSRLRLRKADRKTDATMRRNANLGSRTSRLNAYECCKGTAELSCSETPALFSSTRLLAILEWIIHHVLDTLFCQLSHVFSVDCT
jgi:hypothetical protein